MKQGLINFVLFGAKNSGKTVFLSTLFGMADSVASGNKETKKYLEEKWKKIKNGELPSATSGRLLQLDFDYKSKEHAVHFFMDDYDGYFVETLSNDDEHTQADRDTLKKNIKEAEGLLFFFPYETKFDHDALERFQYEIDTFIQLVKEVYPNHKDLPIPAVIVVAKWDRSPHFKTKNEFKKAIAYIKSVEAYFTAIKKINKFFADIKMMPVSSFGATQDGRNPVKGKIEPHNLTEPFDYMLKVTFRNFEEKANQLQAAGDITKQFKFLDMIYNDVMHYQDGKLINMYAKVEHKYATKVIEKLKKASNINEQEEILDEHYYLYEHLKNERLRKEIDTFFESERAKRKKKLLLKAVLVFLLISILCYGALAFKSYTGERNAFMAIKNADIKNMAKETAQKGRDYLGRYKGRSFFLPFSDVAEHRENVQNTIKKAQVVVSDKLKKRYEQVRDIEFNQHNLLKVNQLKVMADVFPDMQLSLQVIAFANEFEKQTQEKIKIESAINKASALLASDADISELKDILTHLNTLSDNEVIADKRKILEIKIRKLQLSQDYNNLRNNVENSVDIEKISEMISNGWQSDFSDDFAQDLRLLIQNKIGEKDKNDIIALDPKLETVAEIQKQEKQLGEIKSNDIEIKKIDYRYQRDENLKQRLNSAEESIKKYINVINYGINVYVVFGTDKKNNEPLGFSCDGVLGRNNNIILKLNNEKFSYEDKDAHCQEQSNGKQMMIWKNHPFKLTDSVISVEATEKDTISGDDTVTGNINISKDDLLYLYNHGEKQVTIPNTQYYILFH